jgi:energy-converting hydrogenase Eha subunit E
MNDRWGNAEQFLVTGVLLILVAWLTLLTNEIAQLADWPAGMAARLNTTISGIAVVLVFLAYQSWMSIYDFAFSDRAMMWRDSLSGVGFVALGVGFGGQIPILAGLAAGLMLQTQLIRQRVAPQLPDRWLRRPEEVAD